MGLLLIIIALFIPVGAAQDIFDILDEQYITNISELPESVNLVPEKNWQPSREWSHEHCRRKYSPYYIHGWLDVVGFKNLTRINGTDYTNEESLSVAIIRYETHACTLGYPRYNGGWNYKLDTYQQGEQFVARLTATAILYYYYDGIKYYDNITKVFYDYEPLPLQYLQYTQILNPVVNITEYNNSVNPRTEIKLTLNSPAFINYTYNNNHISNYRMVAHVENTSKGVYFANVSAANIWTNGTGSLRQMNDKVIIPGTANISYDNLTIQISDIYNTNSLSKSNFTVIRDTYKFERSFSGLYISLIIIFSIMAGTLYYVAKRAL